MSHGALIESIPRGPSRWVREGVLWASLFACVIGTAAPAPGLRVRHQPQQPRSSEAIEITVEGEGLQSISKAVVEYQVVEPGRYIALNDSAYLASWTVIPLNRKETAGAVSLAATLPGSVQKNRHLIRYRIIESKPRKKLAPLDDDPVPNLGYFVYDGIPAWRAAIHPKGSGAERQAGVFDTNVMRSVQAYHVIAARRAVENVMWHEPTDFGDDEARHKYNYTCTLVSDGKVYDHVRFRARGGVWRHAMGKNMWKFDFPRSHHLEARDDYGQRYRSKWEKLNLSACIQQGDYGYRGEQGMFEAATFKMFNLAGVPAPLTHWIQLRIVSEPEETPADQYRGDFWGLYLAIENIDENFLREHSLPEESLFKVDRGRPQFSYQSPKGASESDARQLLVRRAGGSRASARLETLLDLPHYYSYRSILECCHHYDVDAGKNYFFYRNPVSKLWSVVPWDVDLTWAETMFGGGFEPFMAAGVLRSQPQWRGYQNRLREVRDLLFNTEHAGALIDELAAVISGTGAPLTMAEADRRKWDYHPITQSRYVMSMKATPGSFYEKSRTGDFPGMTRVMKNYVRRRCTWLDKTILGAQPIPATPVLAGTVPPEGVSRSRSQPIISKIDGNIPDQAIIEWHLGDATPGKGRSDNKPGPPGYEIVPIWRTNGVSRAEVPTSVLKAGRSYRLRARFVDSQGNAGHYSKPFEFTVAE